VSWILHRSSQSRSSRHGSFVPAATKHLDVKLQLRPHRGSCKTRAVAVSERPHTHACKRNPVYQTQRKTPCISNATTNALYIKRNDKRLAYQTQHKTPCISNATQNALHIKRNAKPPAYQTTKAYISRYCILSASVLLFLQKVRNFCGDIRQRL
jgi:hypothetical protein